MTPNSSVLDKWIAEIMQLRCTKACAIGLNKAYDRRRHLPQLIALTADDLSRSAEDCAILRKLAQALRQERRRGRTGHWAYNMQRHLALKQAYALESRAVRKRLPKVPHKKKTANTNLHRRHLFKGVEGSLPRRPDLQKRAARRCTLHLPKSDAV